MMDNPLFEIFVQEAEENLEILESRIISIESEPENKDIINEAFRAIHSLKGGAGLAGFNKIKDFSHKAEDLFEKIRSGNQQITAELITILLQTLDVLKIMISNIKNGHEADADLDTGEVLAQIVGAVDSKTPVEKKEISPAAAGKLYFLDLEYYPEIFKSGIDPLMFLQDLRNAGKIIELEIISHEIPDAALFDPQNFYMAWKVFYETELDERGIADIFCFVIDESRIHISCLSAMQPDNPDLENFTVNGRHASSILPVTNSEEDPSESQTDKRVYRRASDLNTGSYIRVPTDKLEHIFNTVSELIVSQARISMLTEEFEENLPDNFLAVSDSLKNITLMLQEQVTSLRMVSLSGTFDRFKRVVRDMAADLDKKINLEISGQDTELDKNMIEKLNDPLKHIVRNCIDHGIETEEQRKKAGKPAEGLLRLAAYLESGKVVIEISDDGRGINKEKIVAKAIEREIIPPNYQLSEGEILNLIFHPGLSTAENVTDISGRGVGMDVVKNAITELNGTIDIITEDGAGTTFRLYLPLTLAIMDGMLVSIGAEKYVIPTLSILEIFRPEQWHLKTISGKGEVVFFRGSYIPMIRLHEILNVSGAEQDPITAELIVININGYKAALLVDTVMEQFQIVLKSLQKNFRRVDNISSATILGNGDVALILDLNSIQQKRV